MSKATVGARIKLARKMAGLPTQAALLEKIPQWKASRLGNYEAGVSSPGPDDVMLIANATDASPCWLMFGHGPIRASQRDLQAIRHQNLSHLYDEGKQSSKLADALDVSKDKLASHLENPFLRISDDMARKIEQIIDVRAGWMDEQHIEHDPLFASFPDELRELLMIYSGMDPTDRLTAIRVIKALQSPDFDSR